MYKKVLGPKASLLFFDHPREALIALLKGTVPMLIISELPFDQTGEDLRQWIMEFKQLPLIVISQFSNLDVIRELFQCGIKDYLTHPVDSNELLIKWELQFEDRRKWETMSNRAVVLGDTCLRELTHKEFQIINLFLSAKNHEVSRDALNFNIWGSCTVHSKTINVHLHNLRKKIQPSGHNIICKRHGHWKLITKINDASFCKSA